MNYDQSITKKRPEGFRQAFELLRINLRDGASTLFPIVSIIDTLRILIETLALVWDLSLFRLLLLRERVIIKS
jgi:hypothetical protein